MLQSCTSDVSKLYKWCRKVVQVMSQSCTSGVAKLYKWCRMNLTLFFCLVFSTLITVLNYKIIFGVITFWTFALWRNLSSLFIIYNLYDPSITLKPHVNTIEAYFCSVLKLVIVQKRPNLYEWEKCFAKKIYLPKVWI